MELHERLAQVLQLRRMTQRELALSIDYSEAAVSKWVQGRAKPPINALMSICEILSVSADWLLWGEKALKDEQPSTMPAWEIVNTTFSTSSTDFNDFLHPAKSLFFTSAWLPNAFDASNPVLSKLVKRGIKMRFVFPRPELVWVPYSTDGLATPNQFERKKLKILSSLLQIQEWAAQCTVELRLILARPVNNIVIVNHHTRHGRVLYIPYLFGDFEHGQRPGFFIDQQQHPQWYDQFFNRYVVSLWEEAEPANDLSTLIDQLRSGN